MDALGRPGRTVQRRLLGRELRKLREAAGMTIQEAASFVRLRDSTLSKMENGKQAILPRNVVLLSLCYKITEPDTADLIKKAEDAAAPSDWSRAWADSVPGWFERYADLEGDANAIRSYDSELVPGLLQTAAYATAITTAARPSIEAEELSRAVHFRRLRQERLITDDGPQITAVINEAALRRAVGGPAVMAEQARYLIEQSDHVNIHILPFSAGAHAAMGTTLLRLAFADSELDFVYLEADSSAFYLEDSADVARYDTIIDRAREASLSREDSRAWLDTVAQQA